MNKFVTLSCLVLTAFAVIGCTNKQEAMPITNDSEAAETQPTDYVGLTVPEAQAFAKANNVPFRVAEQDGEGLGLTMDFVEGRINAVVTNGLVTSYSIEGVFADYDQNSWKDLIADDCQSFFDGCNNCQRMDDGGAACTRKACEFYEEPRCVDDEA